MWRSQIVQRFIYNFFGIITTINRKQNIEGMEKGKKTHTNQFQKFEKWMNELCKGFFLIVVVCCKTLITNEKLKWINAMFDTSKTKRLSKSTWRGEQDRKIKRQQQHTWKVFRALKRRKQFLWTHYYRFVIIYALQHNQASNCWVSTKKFRLHFVYIFLNFLFCLHPNSLNGRLNGNLKKFPLHTFYFVEKSICQFICGCVVQANSLCVKSSSTEKLWLLSFAHEWCIYNKYEYVSVYGQSTCFILLFTLNTLTKQFFVLNSRFSLKVLPTKNLYYRRFISGLPKHFILLRDRRRKRKKCTNKIIRIKKFFIELIQTDGKNSSLKYLDFWMRESELARERKIEKKTYLCSL